MFIYYIYIYIYTFFFICSNFNNESALVFRYPEFHVAHAKIFSLLIITLYRNGAIQEKGITSYMTSFGVLRDVRLTSLNMFRWH